jgi:hypothetical protein
LQAWTPISTNFVREGSFTFSAQAGIETGFYRLKLNGLTAADFCPHQVASPGISEPSRDPLYPFEFQPFGFPKKSVVAPAFVHP